VLNEKLLNTEAGPVRFHWLAENAVRVTHALPGSTSFPPDRPWLRHVLLSQPETAPRQRRLDVNVTDGLVQVSTRVGDEVFAEAEPVRFRKHGMRLSLRIQPGEGFYGWGEWFNAFRRLSGTLRLKNQESLSQLQGRRTYSTIPCFLSSRGYAFFLLNSYESTWEIDPERGMLEIKTKGLPADYLVIYGPAFKEIIKTYTTLTGRPPLPPRWAFGLWTTSYPQGHQDQIVEHARQHRQRQVPLDAVILDYHWEQRFHNFRWRSELIPEPERLIAELKRVGMHLGLIFTPFLNSRNQFLQNLALQLLAKDIPPGMLFADERALPEYEEARSRGYLAHEKARWWFGRGGMLDFSDPRAADWWNAKMRPLYDQGIDFFKNDDGEYLPGDAHSALGMDGHEYHNLYGFFYGKAIYEGMASLDEGKTAPARRPLIYARSAWAGSQRYPALFLGDQKPSYECLKRTLRAGLNLSLLGFAYWTADVFGLDGQTTPETHMRYAQWALLTPVARYFWRPPQIDPTRLPWSQGSQAEDSFRLIAELRYRLLPYYYSLAWQSWQTGLPLLRPLILEFQDDRALIAIYDQVLLGDRLMLCPVVKARATSRPIRLPAGAWHDYWSGQTWIGPGEIEYPGPVDRLPLLARGGTVIPMGPSLQHIPDDHRFDFLQLHCWPPYPAEGLLYEDDGRTIAYQQGAFSITRFTVKRHERRLEIRISPAEGGFPEQAPERRIEVILQRSLPPLQVLVDGKPADGWNYEALAGETSIPAICATQQGIEIEVIYAGSP
jgi:alpha-glucosidase (family GH31 glycosyl hydrolase)